MLAGRGAREGGNRTRRLSPGLRGLFPLRDQPGEWERDPRGCGLGQGRALGPPARRRQPGDGRSPSSSRCAAPGGAAHKGFPPARETRRNPPPPPLPPAALPAEAARPDPCVSAGGFALPAAQGGGAAGAGGSRSRAACSLEPGLGPANAGPGAGKTPLFPVRAFCLSVCPPPQPLLSPRRRPPPGLRRFCLFSLHRWTTDP